MEIKILY
jgi:Ca2+-binding EF-hand superfamily protein